MVKQQAAFAASSFSSWLHIILRRMAAGWWALTTFCTFWPWSATKGRKYRGPWSNRWREDRGMHIQSISSSGWDWVWRNIIFTSTGFTLNCHTCDVVIINKYNNGPDHNDCIRATRLAKFKARLIYSQDLMPGMYLRTSRYSECWRKWRPHRENDLNISKISPFLCKGSLC